MTCKQKILIVDDDPDLLNLLDFKLCAEGFRILKAADGEVAVDLAKAKHPALIILDVNMPRMNGLDACKALKSNEKTRNIPIIMLTVKSEAVDRILGLEFGADDYITKPFNTRELVLRVKNILRRVYQKPENNNRFHFGTLSVDLDSHEVKVKGRAVQLTPTELRLLAGLMKKPGQVKSRDFLLEQIWDYNDKVYSRTVDTHIQRLRTKLKEAGSHIQTVRGVGYRFY
ncbi:MAG: response regulator [Nitrospinales bacterium]